MSVSIIEALEGAGFYVTRTEQDARWLLSQVNQFEELVVKAEDMLEAIEEAETERLEKEYKAKFN